MDDFDDSRVADGARRLTAQPAIDADEVEVLVAAGEQLAGLSDGFEADNTHTLGWLEIDFLGLFLVATSPQEVQDRGFHVRVRARAQVEREHCGWLLVYVSRK